MSAVVVLTKEGDCISVALPAAADGVFILCRNQYEFAETLHTAHRAWHTLCNDCNVRNSIQHDDD